MSLAQPSAGFHSFSDIRKKKERMLHNIKPDTAMAPYKSEIFSILKCKEFLRNLVMRDIKVRYKRSWVTLNLLFIILTLNMVFFQIFKVATNASILGLSKREIDSKF